MDVGAPSAPHVEGGADKEKIPPIAVNVEGADSADAGAAGAAAEPAPPPAKKPRLRSALRAAMESACTLD